MCWRRDVRRKASGLGGLPSQFVGCLDLFVLMRSRDDLVEAARELTRSDDSHLPVVLLVSTHCLGNDETKKSQTYS